MQLRDQNSDTTGWIMCEMLMDPGSLSHSIAYFGSEQYSVCSKRLWTQQARLVSEMTLHAAVVLNLTTGLPYPTGRLGVQRSIQLASVPRRNGCAQEEGTRGGRIIIDAVNSHQYTVT